ncbi:MAG: hypothetical protein ABWZ15_16245 [Acidimicrobiia bacterium]
MPLVYVRGRDRKPRGVEPLDPQRKWRAITVATLVLVPAFWAIMAGLVSVANDDAEGAPNAGAAIAFGLAVIPFVFIVLAFMSEHPRAPQAVLKAMGLFLLVGIPVSAVAADAATGLVAAAGAGGIAALRADDAHTWRARALAIVVACAYTFILVRFAGAITLLSAPVFPFTALGIADHLSDRREAGIPPSSERGPSGPARRAESGQP